MRKEAAVNYQLPEAASQQIAACSKDIPSYLSLLLYDDACSLWDRIEQKWSFGGSEDKVIVSLDNRVQVLPLWLAAVVHCYLI